MNQLAQALLGIFWPPVAPVFTEDGQQQRVWWMLHCILLVIPLTAIWHHGVFYRPRCMLNDFGPEYTPEVVAQWLSRDPSLGWAIVAALLIYAFGARWQIVRLLTAPVFLAFLPLSIWIWDIPFSGRMICHWGHDKRVLPGLGIVMRTRYLYMLGVAAYTIILAVLLVRWALRRLPRVQAISD